MTKKVMISIEPRLHEDGKRRARERRFQSFSAYLVQLIVEDIELAKARLNESAKQVLHDYRSLPPDDAPITQNPRSKSRKQKMPPSH